VWHGNKSFVYLYLCTVQELPVPRGWFDSNYGNQQTGIRLTYHLFRGTVMTSFQYPTSTNEIAGNEW